MGKTDILIVDDSENIRDVLTANFDYLGYDVRTARDGEEAMGMIQKRRPDLVILDVMMPRQNGFQVCRRIKTDPSLAGIPVIFLSAKGQQEDRYWGRDCGAGWRPAASRSPARERGPRRSTRWRSGLWTSWPSTSAAIGRRPSTGSC